jgi:hypothetical protein
MSFVNPAIKVISLKNVSKSTRDLMLITLILHNKKPCECDVNFLFPLASKAAKNKAPWEIPHIRARHKGLWIQSLERANKNGYKVSPTPFISIAEAFWLI